MTPYCSTVTFNLHIWVSLGNVTLRGFANERSGQLAREPVPMTSPFNPLVREVEYSMATASVVMGWHKIIIIVIMIILMIKMK